MIEFKGSQKAFFKVYPKEKRSLDEVYCIVSRNIITNRTTRTCYKFVGTLGEKNFKKVEESDRSHVKETYPTDTEESDRSHVKETYPTDTEEFDRSHVKETEENVEIADHKQNVFSPVMELFDSFQNRLTNLETTVNDVRAKEDERLAAISCVENNNDRIKVLEENLKTCKKLIGRMLVVMNLMDDWICSRDRCNWKVQSYSYRRYKPGEFHKYLDIPTWVDGEEDLDYTFNKWLCDNGVYFPTNAACYTWHFPDR